MGAFCLNRGLWGPRCTHSNVQFFQFLGPGSKSLFLGVGVGCLLKVAVASLRSSRKLSSHLLGICMPDSQTSGAQDSLGTDYISAPRPHPSEVWVRRSDLRLGHGFLSLDLGSSEAEKSSDQALRNSDPKCRSTSKRPLLPLG